jgi:predicted nucleic acid-binding Zn ribbon protein
MERAGHFIAKWKRARTAMSQEELVIAAWRAAVGPNIANRTRPVGLVRMRLVVEVEDAIWQRNLHGLSAQILRNLKTYLDADAPQDLEFRVGVPRRPAQREERIPDEADQIADPLLSWIYRTSRRKAGA